MNFEDRKLRVSAFRIDGGWSSNDHAGALERMRVKRALKLDELPFNLETVDVGWAGGKVELDVELKEENCIVGEELYLTMRIARRKLPASVANALMRKKMADYLRENNAEFVPSKVRKEIKEEVQEQLLRNAVPTLKSVWVVIRSNGAVYAGTAGDTERYQLICLFYQTFHKELVALNDYSLAAEDKTKIDCECPAFEFMTDLFRRSEQDQTVDFDVAPPFDFVAVATEELCTRALAAGDCAAHSREVRAALDEGKLLKKAHLVVTGTYLAGYSERDCWKFVLNRNFSMTGLELPEPEEMEFAARFVERLAMIEAIFGWLREQFAVFRLRVTAPGYADAKKEWLENR